MYKNINYFLYVLGFIILFLSLLGEEKTYKKKNQANLGNKMAVKLPNYTRRLL
jgi:hypothetical protein